MRVDRDMNKKDLKGLPPEGLSPEEDKKSMYYRYWMHLAHHHVYAHYGVRTHQYKLIYYYADIVRNLKDELHRLQENAKDERYVKDVD